LVYRCFFVKDEFPDLTSTKRKLLCGSIAPKSLPIPLFGIIVYPSCSNSFFAGYSEEEVVSEISRKLHTKVTVIGENEDISSAAEELEEKHPSAHYPDSIILATALISDSTLLSYDQGLLDCAKSEGVKTFVPKNKEASVA